MIGSFPLKFCSGERIYSYIVLIIRFVNYLFHGQELSPNGTRKTPGRNTRQWEKWKRYMDIDSFTGLEIQTIVANFHSLLGCLDGNTGLHGFLQGVHCHWPIVFFLRVCLEFLLLFSISEMCAGLLRSYCHHHLQVQYSLSPCLRWWLVGPRCVELAWSHLFSGMLLGWAFGSAAMAAALHVRSSALLATAQEKFRSSCVSVTWSYVYTWIIKWFRLDPNVPVALQAQAALFHGLYLDPRYANRM